MMLAFQCFFQEQETGKSVSLNQVGECDGGTCQDTNRICACYAPHRGWSGGSSVAVECKTECRLE